MSSHSYKHILVAIDFSAHSERALQRALMLEKQSGATVSLLHITEMPIYPMEQGFDTLGEMMVVDMQLLDGLKKIATERLSKLAMRYGAKHCSQQVISGAIKAEILQQAEQQKADLIVMGRHGMSGIKALLGSVTDSILHGASCDVLAVSLDE